MGRQAYITRLALVSGLILIPETFWRTAVLDVLLCFADRSDSLDGLFWAALVPLICHTAVLKRAILLTYGNAILACFYLLILILPAFSKGKGILKRMLVSSQALSDYENEHSLESYGP